MRMALMMSPIMILFISWQASAGLVNIYRPRIRKQIHEEMKKNQPKPVEPLVTTPASAAPAKGATSAPRPRKNRNAGKQHHHK